MQMCLPKGTSWLLISTQWRRGKLASSAAIVFSGVGYQAASNDADNEPERKAARRGNPPINESHYCHQRGNNKPAFSNPKLVAARDDLECVEG